MFLDNCQSCVLLSYMKGKTVSSLGSLDLRITWFVRYGQVCFKPLQCNKYSCLFLQGMKVLLDNSLTFPWHYLDGRCVVEFVII